MITKKEQEANELKHFNKAAGKLSAVALSRVLSLCRARRMRSLPRKVASKPFCLR